MYGGSHSTGGDELVAMYGAVGDALTIVHVCYCICIYAVLKRERKLWLEMRSYIKFMLTVIE